MTVRRTVRKTSGLSKLMGATSSDGTKTKSTESTGRKPGRPKGSKDTKPRKPRSDKGKKRSTYAGKPVGSTRED